MMARLGATILHILKSDGFATRSPRFLQESAFPFDTDSNLEGDRRRKFTFFVFRRS